jgi:hypothetical protein
MPVTMPIVPRLLKPSRNRTLFLIFSGGPKELESLAAYAAALL